MSYRQQVKYILMKTQEEANWDIDNDSDLRGRSGKFILFLLLIGGSNVSFHFAESSEDEFQMMKEYLEHPEMWTATSKKRNDKVKVMNSQDRKTQVSPIIQGVGGCWAQEIWMQTQEHASSLLASKND